MGTTKEDELLAEEIEGEILYEPCTFLLLAAIGQARKDALAGSRDAIEWFGSERFQDFADYLDWNVSYIRSEIWLQVVQKHPRIAHEEWFREMVTSKTKVPI